MNIQEMHIDFLEKSNKLHAYTFKGVETDEIDWFLNQAQLKFIRDVSDPLSNQKNEGHMDSQKRVDQLSSLIVGPKVLKAYIRDSEAVYSNLPPDYFMLETDASVVCTCKRSTLPTTEGTVIKYVKFSLETNDSYYNEVEIFFNFLTSTDITYKLTDNYPSGVNKELAYLIVEDIRRTLVPTGIQVYWENFNGVYAANNLFFVIQTTSSFSLTSASAKIETPENTELELEALAEIDITRNSYDVSGLSTRTRENRLTKADQILQLLEHPHGTTKKDSPISTLEGSDLVVYHRGQFAVFSTVITYVRTPVKVNFDLGINCEIGGTMGQKDDIHRKIVDIAVEMAALRYVTPAAQGASILNQQN